MIARISHYDVLAEIGAGGMGKVYRAHDQKLGRDVALKVLPDDFAQRPEARARFLRESHLAAQLSHPNIATVFAADEADGRLFYVMELVTGETLDRRVRAGGLGREALLELAIPLAEGLAQAHNLGIVHRDLKPGNIIVDDDGRPKILDFGLSRLVADTPCDDTELTRSGQVLGTPPYMSPEQLRGEVVDARSDLFSFGAILYELATGRRPFSSGSLAEVIAAVLHERPAPPHHHNPGIGADLADVIGKLLEKDRDRRTGSAQDLLASLRALQFRPRTRHAMALWWWTVTATTAAIAAVFYAAMPRDAARPRIAVLPFELLGAAEDYFAQGITDAIIAQLATTEGLQVISRHSAAQFAGSTMSRGEFAATLDAGYLLDGTVWRQEAGESSRRIRVTPHLVRVADDTEVWAGNFVEDMDDVLAVFAVQAAIAQQVASALHVELVSEADGPAPPPPTGDLAAYDLYLRGNHYRALGGEWAEKNLLVAIDYYERAIARDPSFALARAQLSRCHTEMYWYWHRHDGDEHLAIAAREGEAALRARPDDPTVRLAMGQYYYVRLDYDGALEHLTHALRSAPHDSEVILNISFVERRRGHWLAALEAGRDAAEIDPRNIEIAFNLSNTLWLMRDYREAERWFARCRDLGPEVAKVYAIEATQALFGEGDPKKARAVLDAAERLGNEREHVMALTSIQVAIWAGDRDRALREIDALPGGLIDIGRFFAPAALLRAGLSGSAPDWEQARRVITDRLSVDPENSALYSAMGIALAGLGRKQEAIAAGRRAVELMPIELDAWSGSLRATDLAQIHVMVGEPDAAIALLERLLELPGELGRASLAVDPRWRQLRGEAHFQRLCR